MKEFLAARFNKTDSNYESGTEGTRQTAPSSRPFNPRNNKQYVLRGYNNSRQQSYRPNDHRPYKQQKQQQGAPSSKKQ